MYVLIQNICILHNKVIIGEIIHSQDSTVKVAVHDWSLMTHIYAGFFLIKCMHTFKH